jgi:hypothetical protein
MDKLEMSFLNNIFSWLGVLTSKITLVLKILGWLLLSSIRKWRSAGDKKDNSRVEAKLGVNVSRDNIDGYNSAFIFTSHLNFLYINYIRSSRGREQRNRTLALKVYRKHSCIFWWLSSSSSDWASLVKSKKK